MTLLSERVRRIQSRLVQASALLNEPKLHPVWLDGDLGAYTEAAILAAIDMVLNLDTEVGFDSIVPQEWLPAADIRRVIVHWTGGGYVANAKDRRSYNILVEGTGDLVRGPSLALHNNSGVSEGYAQHTKNLNSGSAGISACCMAGAKESPFDPGTAPLTELQWAKLAMVAANICARYNIPVSPRTVLTHAEVEGTLGVRQAGKWDITRLVFAPDLLGAKAIGDDLRRRVDLILE